MEWLAISGPKSFLIALPLVGFPLWFALMSHRAHLVTWIASPLVLAVLIVIAAIIFAGVQPLIVRTMRVPEASGPCLTALVLICTVIGYGGGWITARHFADGGDDGPE